MAPPLVHPPAGLGHQRHAMLRSGHWQAPQWVRPSVAAAATQAPRPAREVKMVPLYLPGDQPAYPAPDVTRVNSAQQTDSGARLIGSSSGGNGAAPPSSNANDAAAWQSVQQPWAQQYGNGNGAAAERMATAAQPLVEAAATTAADAMSQSRTGELMVEAEFADSGYRELPTDANFAWSRDSYSKMQRTLAIWSALATLRARTWLNEAKWTYPGGFTENKQSVRRRATAAWLRETLLDLGPTFIKIGQLFSTRSDLLPSEFTEELALLQDRVPAFPLAKVRSIIQVELGASPERLFAAFDERPLAAASLGQVHRAQLHDGTEVVVKVQRPGLKELFDIDLEQLGRVAALLDAQDEGRRDLRGIHAECATILRQEIDYINEGRNADRFRRNFRASGVDWVEAPVVHWATTSPRIITLSYLPGIKITDIGRLKAAGLDTSAIAARATEAYLLQILKHGFLHADPHPGNIAVGLRGQLLFYDFGMMSSTAGSKDRLLDVFYGIYRQDSDQVIKALIALNIIVPTADMVSIRRSMQYFLKNFQQATQREETIGAIGEDLFAIALDQPFRFPAAFTFVLRAFSTLEGLGKALDSSYSFSEVAKPYALELLNLQDAQQAQGFVLERLQEQAVQISSDTAAIPARVAAIGSTLAQLEAGELKLRTRVLESERADRRQAVLQSATVNAIGAAGLANMATQFGLAGQAGLAWCASIGATAFGVFVFLGFRRIRRLDKFEKEIRA